MCLVEFDQVEGMAMRSAYRRSQAISAARVTFGERSQNFIYTSALPFRAHDSVDNPHNTAIMPPTNPFSALRTLPIRQRPTATLRAGFQRPAVYRSFADDATNKPNKLPQAEGETVGPNMQQQEHVSEEAAKMAKITGGQGPDVEQGTPVQEVWN